MLAAGGVTLDADKAWERYRLFAIYSWLAATTTLAMGSKWQPERIGLAAPSGRRKRWKICAARS